MKMRHILLFLLLVTLVINVACGGTTEESNPTAVPATEVVATTPAEEVEPTDVPAEEPTDVPAEETKAPTDSADCDGEPVEIRWFVGLGTGTAADQIKVEDEVVKGFNDAHDCIELKVDYVDNKEASNVLNTQIAAGNAPDIVGPVGIAGRAAFTKSLLDLKSIEGFDKIDLSDFKPELVEFYNIEGQGQIGLPFGIFPSFIFINPDLFEEAEVPLPPTKYGEPYIDKDGNEKPWNLDTLREVAMQLTFDESGNDAMSADFDSEKIVQFGFTSLWNGDGRGDFAIFGADKFFDASGKAVLPEKWVTAAEWYQNAMHVDHFMPDKAYDASELMAAGNGFNSGNLAMAYTHLWYTCCMADMVKAGGRWDAVPMPAAADGTTTAKMHADTFSILKFSKHPKEALEVLAYLTDDAADQLTQIYGAMPAKLSLQATYFDKVAENYEFDVNWDVVADSMLYPDNPSHEEGMPNPLESAARVKVFDELLRSDPELDVRAAMETMVKDLQVLYEQGELPPAEGSSVVTDTEEVETEDPAIVASPNGLTFDGPAEPAECADGPVEVRWFVGLGTGTAADQIKVEDEVVKGFNDAHDCIELKVDYVDNKEASNVLNTQIAAGNAPDLVGPVGIAGRAAFTKSLLDLTTIDEYDQIDLSDFKPELVEFYNIEGQGQIGLPFGIFPSFIFVNTDLFEEAEVPLPPTKYGEPYIDKDGNEKPWNIDTMREVAMQLTFDENGNDAMSADFDPEAIVQFGFTSLWNGDGRGDFAIFGADKFFDADGKAVLPEKWVTAAEWYHKAMHADHFMPDKAYDASELMAAGNGFNSGNLAMAYTHLWYTCCMADMVKAGGRWDAVPMPAAADGTTTAKMHADTFSILKFSKHPKEALEVLAYLTDDAADQLTQIYGAMPAKLSLQATYFDKVAENYEFDVNWDVVADSMLYPDNPSHEEGMPNPLESAARVKVFDELLRSDPELDVRAAMETLVKDLQTIYDAAP